MDEGKNRKTALRAFPVSSPGGYTVNLPGRVVATVQYHFVIAVWRAKEHNPARKLLEYHR
jgi:hypothetical protein